LKVLLFAAARQAAGCDEIIMDCDGPGLTEGELWDRLVANYPALAAVRNSARLAVNCDYLRPGRDIAAGDEVAIIPPVSGG